MTDLEELDKLGSYLRKRRKAAGLSFRGAAKAIGVAHSQISKWESGEKRPTPQRLAQLAPLYGEKDWRDLFTDPDMPTQQQKIQRASPAVQRAIGALLATEDDTEA